MALILIIDDDVATASACAKSLRGDGAHEVTEARTGAKGLEAYAAARPDLVLLDVDLPDMTGIEVLSRLREDHPVVIMMTAGGDVPTAVEALRSGAENVLTKPVDPARLAAAVAGALEKGALRRANRYLAARRGSGAHLLLGSSAPMRELSAQISLLAESDRTTALIVGESGSGKGRVAELVHARSPRAARPFVQVNCAALTAESLDSELFGVESPVDGTIEPTKRGLFEIADGGTLFLDEIGDLDPRLQPKLLRVLEGKGFRRHGGTAEITPNVRVIAATGKDLVHEVTAGRFREDLYYRLSVMPVSLPPLRARAREDLVDLTGHLLDELAPTVPGAPTALADGVLEAILRFAWPGNIRELRNVLERAMLLARGQPKIGLGHLPPEVQGASGADVAHHVPRSLAEVEKAHIDRTLKANAHNRTHTAKELGISRATLIKKIREYNLLEKPRS